LYESPELPIKRSSRWGLSTVHNCELLRGSGLQIYSLGRIIVAERAAIAEFSSDPNDPQDTNYSGYEFWLNKLNLFDGDYNKAQMVKAFIVSVEYRCRFGGSRPTGQSLTRALAAR
jgi:hypothetical protein